MNIIEIIEKKRDGQLLSAEEIKYFVDDYVAGKIPDYQMAALLMAIYLNGMTFEESAWLTRAMLNSGQRIDLQAIPGVKVDKHSTGGVGDKVSLVLAPLMAVLEVPVPMISGRSLGHSGGTLDKLEAIPGFNTNLSAEEFIQEIKDIGVALIGQTDTIVPADKKIYALRDSIATVNSIPLITASIMSKKIAEGANGLVLDVKVGNGAFFQTESEAIELATRLIAIGKRSNLPTVALLTAMNQPLGWAVGTWLETREAIAALQGNAPPDLMMVTCALGALMLLLAKKTKTIPEGLERCQQAIASGKAFDKFLEIVKWQGGDTKVILQPETYPRARYSLTIRSLKDGYIHSIDALRIGRISMRLGAGRSKKEEQIDYTSGIVLRKKQCEALAAGETLAVAYSNDKSLLSQAKDEIGRAFQISQKPPPPEKLILKMIDAEGMQDWNY